MRRAMKNWSRRDVLKGASALGLAALGRPIEAAAPPAQAVTPALIEAARKEGKMVWYTAVDLPVAERLARSFEAKYPGVACRVARSGAERWFQRIGQEYSSRVHAVAGVNSSSPTHLIAWNLVAL